jgi:hypothetical protein
LQDTYKTSKGYRHEMFTLCGSNWRTKHESSADTEEDTRSVCVVGRRYCEDLWAQASLVEQMVVESKFWMPTLPFLTKFGLGTRHPPAPSRRPRDRYAIADVSTVASR